METKTLLLFCLPLIMLILLLGWIFLLVRQGKPFQVAMKGLGVTLQFTNRETDKQIRKDQFDKIS